MMKMAQEWEVEGTRVEEGDVSRGALGLGFEGWSHKYCCTSSMPGGLCFHLHGRQQTKINEDL